MSAKIIRLTKKHGPATEAEAIEAEVRKAFAQTFKRRMSDGLAAMIAEAIRSAPCTKATPSGTAASERN